VYFEDHIYMIADDETLDRIDSLFEEICARSSTG
tara:strand:- start:111 stop:212 length:102 start_codon:yes stop_codon:yes gene_type:complete